MSEINDKDRVVLRTMVYGQAAFLLHSNSNLYFTLKQEENNHSLLVGRQRLIIFCYKMIKINAEDYEDFVMEPDLNYILLLVIN